MVTRPVFGVYKKRGKTVLSWGGGADVIVIVAMPEIVPSVTDFAVSVTVAGDGIAAGAVNSIVVWKAASPEKEFHTRAARCAC